MSAIHVVAIITPVPGKEARIKELLIDLAKNVKENEKDVVRSRYQVFEQYNGEAGNVFVVQEIYDTQAALDSHFKTDYFQALGKQVEAEGLLAAPLDVKSIKPIAGF